VPSAVVEAIVLRRRDRSESDRSLVLFTREYGKIEALAKGARKAGSRLAGVSEPLVVADFHIAWRGKSRYITQAQLGPPLVELRSDYGRLLASLTLMEIIEAAVPWESPDPDEFEFAIHSLKLLDASVDTPAVFSWCAVHLLSLVGYGEDFEEIFQTSGKSLWGQAHHHIPLSQEELRKATTTAARLQDVEEPPKALNAPCETLRLLLEVWQHHLETRLPAFEGLVHHFDTTGPGSTKV
jgi:DNA repair protein RecO (recombination protein O)